MQDLVLMSLIVLWGVALINLLLTLRVVRWVRSFGEQSVEMKEQQELVVGAPAPEFSVKALDGTFVRLADYAGRALALIFVSPNCGACHTVLPMLAKLAPLAKEHAGVEIVLVSDMSAAKTRPWLDTMAESANIPLHLPVLVAPRSISTLIDHYNPHGYFPYYCFIDAHGIIQSHDSVGRGDWPKLKQAWQGQSGAQPSSRLARQYQ